MATHSYRETLKQPGLQPFLWTQFLGAFNDNLFKIVVSMLAVHLVAADSRRPRALDRQRRLHPAVPAVLRLRRTARRHLQQAHGACRQQVARNCCGDARPRGVRLRPPPAHLRGAVSDRAAGHILQPGEVRNPARDAARSRPLARERRARDEHVRRDRPRHGGGRLSVRSAGRRVSG